MIPKAEVVLARKVLQSRRTIIDALLRSRHGNLLMSLSYFLPLALAVGLAGCGSMGSIGLGPVGNTSGHAVQTAGGLPPATASVGSARPASVAPASPASGVDAGAAGSARSSAAGIASASGGLARTDLLGGWTIASAGESCQLFMTLTTWAGGYRASTRGCNNAIPKSISAWNLDGKQVVLAGTGGAPVAHLSSSGNNRFNGRTETGEAPVAFYR
jgi:hypothetical protein